MFEGGIADGDIESFRPLMEEGLGEHVAMLNLQVVVGTVQIEQEFGSDLI